jgi:hypothetical protein
VIDELGNNARKGESMRLLVAGTLAAAGILLAGCDGGSDNDDTHGPTNAVASTGMYITFSGTEHYVVTTSSPQAPTTVMDRSYPIHMVIDPDGRFILPNSPGRYTSTQDGDSYTYTYVPLNTTWAGTRNGDTIAGTISGHAVHGSLTWDVSEGTFSMTRSGESSTMPDMPGTNSLDDVVL